MKKRWVFLFIYMLFLAALISIAFKAFKEDDNPKVVVVAKSVNAEYWRIFKSGAEKAFEDLDVDGKVIAPDSASAPVSQAHMLKNVLEQNPDALIVSPTHPSAVISVLIEYKEKNIPVLLADTNVNWGGQTAYIGTDNPMLGEKAGALLASALQPGDQVALIHGSLTDPVNDERVKGAKESLEEAGMKIAVMKQGYDEFWNVKPVMENILRTCPDIKGVFTTDDSLALEALKVIEERELKIPVVGADGIMEMVKYIEKGALSATVAQNPYDIGYMSVEQALKAIKGKSVAKKIDSGIDIITQDNAKDKLRFQEKVLY